MPDRLVWSVGNQSPSITEVIEIDGAPFNLTSSSVRFRMREVGSSTLVVDGTATVTNAAAGAVRYDWGTADLATAGEFLVWWSVTTSGKTQDVGEALIEVRAHAPLSNVYVELEAFKSSLTLSGTTFADGDAEIALEAASRAVDAYKNTRFYTSTETRYYDAEPFDRYIRVNDLVSAGTVSVDFLGDATYSTTWTEGTEFYLDPPNAIVDGQPFRRLVLREINGSYFSTYQRGIRITGVFGWPSVPPQVKIATQLLANRLVKRLRETPYAILTVMAGEMVAAARLGRIDPDVAEQLDSIPGASVPLFV